MQTRLLNGQFSAARLIKICVLMFAAMLSACSTHKQIADELWPIDMPPKADFVAMYHADPVNMAVQTEAEYLSWIVRFYQGSQLYRRGWIKMSNELISQLPNPAEAPEIREKIAEVGFKMSAEWAKKSDSRTVYLSHVSVWGNALLESIERDDCLPLVNRVNQDIDDLLARRLTREDITAERYYPSDPDSPFL